MVDIRSYFDDLKNHLRSAEKEESNLEQEEKVERKYIQDLENGSNSIQEFQKAVNIFLEEVEEADKIAEELMTAEKDEFKIEEIVKDNRVELNQQIADEFENDSIKLDKLVKKFAKEVRELNAAGEHLQQISSRFDDSETKEKLDSGLEKLNKLDTKTDKIVRNEAELSRRDFTKLAGGAAVGAGLTSGQKLNDSDLAQRILQQEEKKCKSMPSDTSLTKKEASKPNRNVREANGKIKEKLVEEGLEFEAELLRTSSKSGRTVLNIQNNTNERKKLEIKLYMENWGTSGTHNYRSGGPNVLIKPVEIPPGSNFALGSDLVKLSDSPGRIKYRIEGSRLKEEMAFNVPSTIVENHVISNTGEIGGPVELSYQTYKNASQSRAELQLVNTVSETMSVSLSFSIPSGWSFNSLKGFGGSGAGLAATSFDLDNSRSASATLTKNSSEASDIAVASLIFCPQNQVEKANYYLVPINLNK